MKEFLELTFLENDIENFLWFLGWVLVGLIARTFITKLIVRVVFRLFRKYTHGINRDKFDEKLTAPLNFILLLVFLFLGLNHLHFPHSWELAPIEEFGVRKVLSKIFQVVFAYAALRVLIGLIALIGDILVEKAGKTETKQDDQLIPFAIEIVKIFAVIFMLLVVLSSVFHLNIGSLIAGLGIGGLAIALAAKESLENLLGSFTIFLDKPFVVGDLVQVAGITGVIEKVGFRSTRIRTLEKSFVTVPNKKMIDAELDNLSMRTFRRVDFRIGVLYGTSADVVKKVVDGIQNYIDEHERTNQDGEVHFIEFGSSSLDIMVLYYIDTMDWSVFLEVKEEINYKIMEIVKDAGTDFAFPTRTLHVESMPVNK